MHPDSAPSAVPVDVASREVLRLEQHFAYSYESPIRDLRHRLMTIPPARHGRQVRLDHGLDVRGDPVLVSSSRDRFGNHVIDVRAASVSSGLELRSWATVEQVDVVDGRPYPTVSAAEASTFLEPTPLTTAGAPVTEFAAELRGSDALEVAERISRWTHQALRYEWGITSVRTTANEALAGGVGVCQDFAHVMLAACRAAGVPARYVSGHLVGEGGSHAWVEVLVRRRGRLGGYQAVAFDPTHDRTVGHEGYVTVAVGRDYTDVAPTSGVFAGSCPGVLEASKVLRPA